MDWQPRRSCDHCLHYGICTISQKNNHKTCDNFKSVQPPPPRPKTTEQIKAEQNFIGEFKAQQDFAEQLEKFKEAWQGVAQAIVDGLNGKHTPTVKEKPKVDKCEGCIYRGEYQDMGATMPICKKGIDLAEAVNMRNDPNPCKYKTTWREVDEYIKRREENNGT